MRWATTLLALGLMMALFHHLTAAGPLEARATLALGFLLVAAQLGGDVAAHWKLPRLTGNLAVGFAVGPAWLSLIRADEANALEFVALGAVALIAFAAGSELKLTELARQRRALGRVATGAIAFPFLFVTVAMLALGHWLPFIRHQPYSAVIVVALVLGTVAAAFSPTVTIAIMEETGAHGPFVRTILGITVVGDVVLIVVLSVVLAVAHPLTAAGTIDPGAVLGALATVGISVAAGAALGSLVAVYLRAIQRDTALFLVALALVTAEVAQLLHLDTILIGLAAGFVVENFSAVEGERLRAEFARSTRPVNTVFFALAGAGLRLGALADVAPWVLLVIALRYAGLRVAMRWAGRSPSVGPDLVRHAWAGLISQAGVALGLALVVRRAFPEWGVSLEAFIVTMISLHEAVGPILFRRALVAVGEVKEGVHAGADSQVVGVGAGARGGGL